MRRRSTPPLALATAAFVAVVLGLAWLTPGRTPASEQAAIQLPTVSAAIPGFAPSVHATPAVLGPAIPELSLPAVAADRGIWSTPAEFAPPD